MLFSNQTRFENATLVANTTRFVALSESDFYLLSVPLVQHVGFFNHRQWLEVYNTLLPHTLDNISHLIRPLFNLYASSISFSGKGYKLLSNKRTTFAFSFGYSHMYYVYNPVTFFMFKIKTRGFFVGLGSFVVKQAIIALRSVKPINIFTNRGVRARKQWIWKKTGKVSMYM